VTLERSERSTTLQQRRDYIAVCLLLVTARGYRFLGFVYSPSAPPRHPRPSLIRISRPNGRGRIFSGNVARGNVVAQSNYSRIDDFVDKRSRNAHNKRALRKGSFSSSIFYVKIIVVIIVVIIVAPCEQFCFRASGEMKGEIRTKSAANSRHARAVGLPVDSRAVNLRIRRSANCAGLIAMRMRARVTLLDNK